MTKARRIVGYVKLVSIAISVAAILWGLALARRDELVTSPAFLLMFALAVGIPSTLLSWLMDYSEWRRSRRGTPPA